MEYPITQTIDAATAIKEALRADEAGEDRWDIVAWLRAWSEGWGGDSFDAWDGVEPLPPEPTKK